MLRPLKGVARSLLRPAYYSTTNRSIASLNQEVKNCSRLDLASFSDFGKILRDYEDKDGHELLELFSLIESKGVRSLRERNQVLNEFLAESLRVNFSLYFKARELQDFQWSSKALMSLISHNPGRVFQSWDLLQEHGLAESSEQVYLKVIEKLLLGEQNELQEEEQFLTIERVAKSIVLVRKLVPEDQRKIVKVLLESLAKLNVASGINMARIDLGLGIELLRDYELDDKSFLFLFRYVFEANPQLLPIDMLAKFMATSVKFQSQSASELEKETKNLGKLVAEVSLHTQVEAAAHTSDMESLKQLAVQVMQFVEDNKLDVHENPKSLLLRIELIRFKGLFLDKLGDATAKYHQYQTHAKFGLEILQLKLVQCYCFDALRNSNETSLKIAATLLPPEIPIYALQCLILAQAEFLVEKSLQLYNTYINHVSTKINPETSRSPAGLLTDSLVLSFLYNNDRLFAQLLLDKAIDNNIVSNDEEIAAIKQNFKFFGDSFDSGSNQPSRNLLNHHLLAFLTAL